MALMAIHGGIVLTMNETRAVYQPGTILIDGSRIAAVGSADTVTIPRDAVEIDATGTAVLPGFINAHTHVSGILLRGGLGRPRSFADWLFNLTYPGLAVFSPDDTRCGALLFATEALRSGITTVVDNRDPGRPSEWEPHWAAAVAGYGRAGIRAVCAQMFYDEPLADPNLAAVLDQTMAAEPLVRHEGWLHWTTSSSVVPPLDEAVDTDVVLGRLENLIRRFDGTEAGRVRVWPAPARPSLVSDRALVAAHGLALKHDAMWTTHLMDYAWDRRDPLQSNIDRLSALGVLNRRLLAAHCLGIDSRGIHALADARTPVTVQTTSLCCLGERPAPVRDLRRAGLTVALGTDDPNLNDSVDMFQEMKLMTCIHRAIDGDPSSVSPEDAIEMATIEGAVAIGMADQLGSIEEGKSADLISIGWRHARTTPIHSLTSALVLQASALQVQNVLVDGRLVISEGSPTFMTPRDELELYQNAQDRSTRIRRDSGITVPDSWPVITSDAGATPSE